MNEEDEIIEVELSFKGFNLPDGNKILVGKSIGGDDTFYAIRLNDEQTPVTLSVEMLITLAALLKGRIENDKQEIESYLQGSYGVTIEEALAQTGVDSIDWNTHGPYLEA